MNTGRRRRRTPFYFYPLILLLLLLLGYGALTLWQHRSQRKAVERTLLEGMAMEVRFRTIDTFTSLFIWCTAVNALEEACWNESGRYFQPQDIPQELIQRLRTDDLARIVRQAIWDQAVFLDTFIEFDDFKSRLDSQFGRNFEKVLEAFDESQFSFEFELDDGSDYDFKVYERRDVNQDGDSDDFFFYRRSRDGAGIRFVDRGQRLSLDHFIIEYSMILDERNPVVPQQR